MQQSIGKIKATLLASLMLIVVFACSDSTDDDSDTIGNWTKTTPFKGRPRSGAISFTIGSKAYVGLGYDGDEYLSDFYVYDLALGYWETKKAFPGTLRERAVAFSVDGNGYIGLGYNRDEDKEELGDFWKYDPADDEWIQVNDFEGTARYNAVTFTIGNKAYVGTGYDGDKYNSDFWEYNVSEDSWTEIASFPGEKIESGFAFVIGANAYVAGGRNNGLYNAGFWMFNAESRTWTNKAPDDDASDYDEFELAVARHDAVAVTVDDQAYVMCGYSSSGVASGSVYVYDAVTNEWGEKTAFEGAARIMAVGFTLNNRIFLGTGQNGSSRFDDIWEFKPGEEYDETN
ncbi:Kelch repeat-containing protein [Pseudochryseolinea flava]|uniref:Galactose oxidase n=1 Tax=Pseudochryseolinea flava TaxID=2059302 RepID=A0A364Y023_9BACT|nr:kelch repeat-containing protein [Pseudochryseolinea flava]RAW00009.1 galactose oxidase [Pseudochryseolinea flava]